MRVEAGNVLAAKMNAHRHQWNGSICAQPQSWNCGADAAFRENNCAEGVPRCFHLDVFKPAQPRFVTPDPTVIQAVRDQPRLLDNQVLVFYGGRFGAQQGIAPGDFEQALYGLYRVKDAVLDDSRTPHRLLIEPFKDCWAIFPRVKLAQPTLRSVQGVAYLKQLRARSLIEVIEQALDQLGTQKSDGWTPEHDKHLRRAKEQLPQWLSKAEESSAKLPAPKSTPRVAIQAPAFPSVLADKLSKLKIETVSAKPIDSQASQPAATPAGMPEPDSVPATEPHTASAALSSSVEAVQRSAPEPASEPADVTELPALSVEPTAPIETKSLGPLTTERYPGAPAGAATVSASPLAAEMSDVATTAIPEAQCASALAERLDGRFVTALSIAFITKSLVILTGAPGSGKSWIASRLIDDATRERTVIVPVASTWRGREDLLGYVNPVSGHFEPTEFTQFLFSAEEAWDQGDRRARLVIFEEFNLSQPEHWLSDLLVRLEYEPERRHDRTLVLGGQAVAGFPQRQCRVALAPSLRFIATLNNDHTVKPLSPRVLDRSALIEVSSSGRDALKRADVAISDDLADVIDDLNDLVAPRGAAFSVRSARSLRRAVEAGLPLGLQPPHALDLVLAQEVLSRVRLLAGDPRDEQLLARLQVWSQRPECADLTVCAARIAEWAEALTGGRDVFQA